MGREQMGKVSQKYQMAELDLICLLCKKMSDF